MPGVTRVGVDFAGPGAVLGPGSLAGGTPVYAEGAPVSLLGDTVSPHGDPPHSSSLLLTGSSTVFGPGGLPLVRQGDPATCGHVATGSVTVIVGD